MEPIYPIVEVIGDMLVMSRESGRCCYPCVIIQTIVAIREREEIGYELDRCTVQVQTTEGTFLHQAADQADAILAAQRMVSAFHAWLRSARETTRAYPTIIFPEPT